MAITAAEYLKNIGAERQTPPLPIAAHRGKSFYLYNPDTLDPHNNIGRFCDIRPRWNFLDDRPGRTWQIIRYSGMDYENGTEGARMVSWYIVAHVDDPGSYGMRVPMSAITNLW